jgi:hypothetical protein
MVPSRPTYRVLNPNSRLHPFRSAHPSWGSPTIYLTRGASARVGGVSHSDPPNGTRTRFHTDAQIAVSSRTSTVLLNKRARDSLETFRRVSRPGSLTIGSGSSALAVDMRRREATPPGVRRFHALSRDFRDLRPPISTSPRRPRERLTPLANPPTAPTNFIRWAVNSPALGLPAETRSYLTPPRHPPGNRRGHLPAQRIPPFGRSHLVGPKGANGSPWQSVAGKNGPAVNKDTREARPTTYQNPQPHR